MSPETLTPALQHLGPDASLLLGTSGICLGLVEFNRPGRVLPGALGLLLFLLAAAWLAQHGIRAGAAAVLLAAALTLTWNVYRQLPAWILCAVTIALAASLYFLPRNLSRDTMHVVTAVACGLLLGGLCAWLSHVAYRARRAKALD